MSEFSAGGDKGMTWRDFAACQGANLDFFYLREGERHAAARSRLERGKRICLRCPVLAKCREEAFRVDDQHAVMGGMTPDERDAVQGRYVRPALTIPGRDDAVIEALVAGKCIPDASRINVAHACVRLWRLGDVSIAALGRKFDISAGSVRNWIERSERGLPPISPKWWAQQHGHKFAEVS